MGLVSQLNESLCLETQNAPLLSVRTADLHLDLKCFPFAAWILDVPGNHVFPVRNSKEESAWSNLWRGLWNGGFFQVVFPIMSSSIYPCLSTGIKEMWPFTWSHRSLLSSSPSHALLSLEMKGILSFCHEQFLISWLDVTLQIETSPSLSVELHSGPRNE